MDRIASPPAQIAALTPADRRFLWKSMRKGLMSWTIIAMAILFFVLMLYDVTTDMLGIFIIAWIAVCVLIVFSGIRAIRNNQKYILRGPITNRYIRYEDDRNKSGEPSYILVISDFRVIVERSVYNDFHKRDIAEIHMLDDQRILSCHLLERPGEKNNRTNDQ